MITYEEFLDELVPVNMNKPMRREDYYKIHMNGVTPKSLYHECYTFRKMNTIFAWLHHYNHEFSDGIFWHGENVKKYKGSIYKICQDVFNGL